MQTSLPPAEQKLLLPLACAAREYSQQVQPENSSPVPSNRIGATGLTVLGIIAVWSFSGWASASQRNNADRLPAVGVPATRLIVGEVRNILTDEPVIGAEVSLRFRIITRTSGGFLYMSRLEESGPVVTSARTDANGTFSLLAYLPTETPVFVTLQVTNDGFESLTLALLRIDDKPRSNVALELTPTTLTTDDIDLIQQKLAREKARWIQSPPSFKPELHAGVNATAPLDTTINVPDTVYVSNASGYTGYMNLDEFVAGVVSAEIGDGFPFESLKAQAVAARSYALRRYYDTGIANGGQAYNGSWQSKSHTAALNTSKIVVLYDGAIIDALYSARCNGDSTLNSEDGLGGWGSSAQCLAGGLGVGVVPYLRSRSCSGHINCSTTGENCCNEYVEGRDQHIYGHGVGLCQRGAQDFAGNYGQDWQTILNDFYTSVDIANGPGLTVGSSAQITANGVNLRSSACGSVVGTANVGDTGTVTSGPQITYCPGLVSGTSYITWWQVSLNGQAGEWVAEDFLQWLGSTSGTTGTISVTATLDGNQWSGPLNFSVSGPSPISGTTVPISYASESPGGYTPYYGSGGPSAAGAPAIDPPMSQNLTAGGTISWTFRFSSVGVCTAALVQTASVKANAACTPCYSFSTAVSPTGSGTASASTPTNCTGGYTSGTTISILASPNSGYQFGYWTASNCNLANPNSSATTCTLTGSGSATVTANLTAVALSGPTVSTSAATSITSTSATLNGTVNPNGTATSAFFSWGTTTAYTWNTAPQNEGSGTSPIPFSFNLTGLNCGTTYHFAAAASSTAGSPIGTDSSFTTGACPTAAPAVTTNAASGISQTVATLNGAVNPNGSSTTTAFDYGTSVAYGSSVAAQSFSDSSSHSIYASVTNLSCGTTYHFRAEATNAGGTTDGADMVFSTPACSSTDALWVKRFALSTPVAAAVAPATDGGAVIAAGANNSTTDGTDLIVFRVDRFGGISWQKSYSPSYGALSYYGIQPSVARATDDGGFVVAGSIHVNVSGCVDDHMWIVRIDGSGNTLWQHAYGSGCFSGGMVAHDIRPTYDGGFIVVGETSAFGAGGIDALVLKLDSQGNILWQKTYGGARADIAHGVKQTLDGGFLVVGESSSFSTSSNVWVLKLDQSGSVQWQRIYGGLQGLACEQTLDGGYIVAAYDGVGALLLRLNADGSIKWQEAIRSAPGGAYASDVVLAWDGGYVVSGSGECFSTCSGGEAFVFEVDDTGTMLWQRSYPGELSAGGPGITKVARTATGGYVAAGPLSSPAEFLVMRLDGSGQVGSCSDLKTSTATAAATSFTPAATDGVALSGAAVVESYGVTEASLQLSPTNVCSAAHAELPAPTSLVATATSTTQVDVAWSTVASATQYQVLRRAAGGSFEVVGSPGSPPFHDSGVSPGNAYLYKVRAFDGSGTVSPDSNTDLATTVLFTDDPLVPRVTVVKAVHFGELRTAVNAVRTLAGLATAGFTNTSLAGLPIQAIHITELRTALDAARTTLLLPPITYTNPSIAAGASIIFASDITDLRNGVK